VKAFSQSLAPGEKKAVCPGNLAHVLMQFDAVQDGGGA
jgi:hypothetical protein